MRNRSNSGVRLDLYQRIVLKTILKHQNPVTGLLPATPSHPHAWIRDNVYSILSVWGLALAYKKNADLDEDRAKAYELEQSVVKLMRGLMRCMLMQVDKLEKFKLTQYPRDSLHAKYSVTTGKTVVGDFEYGHLQIDAVSIFLLTLAQMTASGLQIVFTLDEVAFIQNLVFYIQSAYRIPDYGIWERGDKTNHGLPELNASSIGMAKGALEAMNELDLFGARGGPSSVIHVMIDEAQQCQAILSSMLPRESNSKEVDAALLSIISYPAFAINDPDLIQLTRDTIIEKLRGCYGCCRFLRDGYKTAMEDPKRLHYEPWELQMFENIECEWPLFFAYLVLDGIFYGNKDQVREYSEALDELLIKSDAGMMLMPELYTVPEDKVDAEYKNPKSQQRVAIGKVPHAWGQSLYVLGRLLSEGFLSPGELDPLNRRFITEPKPDLVVQVVILAEDRAIQTKLDYYDLKVQTISEVSPIQVYPARVLSHIYAHLGKNQRLGLSGRPDDSVGLLATSKLYTLGDQVLTFLPQFVDQLQFYLPLDSSLIIDMCKTEIQYLRNNWTMMGRPVLVFPILESLLDYSQTLPPTLVATMKKLQTGYINGTRVQLGNLSDFINTSCVTNLTFLTEGDQDFGSSNLLDYIGSMADGYCNRPRLLSMLGMKKRNPASRRITRKSSVKGIIRRSCSIQIDNTRDLPIYQMSSTSASSSSTTSPNTPDVNLGRFTFPQASTALSEVHSHPHLKGDREEKAVTAYNESQYEGLDVAELVEQLKDAETLHEQADIIHFLFVTRGPEWDTEMDNKPGCKVKDLINELYEKAGHLKQWWLVRHTAGMLRKRVEDLARAATDILVRQKQLAVGLPPEPREKIITRPLPPDELAAIIHDACGEDSSTAMLTQEILVYLAMFIRTEPKLFNEMLRLRVGLIIQVMASELSRTLKCTGEEASDQLLNLSPYEMKTLLHHILSGKEFGITSVHSSAPEPRNTLSIMSKNRKKEEFDKFRKDIKTVSAETLQLDSSAQEHLQETMETDRHGQWLRRRRLDGALNRVPVGFYPSMWKVLKRTPGLSIAGVVLNQNLTKEMTPGELKFALQVEMALNRIPEPEYRQLMVEAMEVLTLVVENDFGITNMDQIVQVDALVRRANELFLGDQATHSGDATDCCAVTNRPVPPKCQGAANVCIHFYDSAPSGRFGSMTYMARAVAQTLQFPSEHGEIDCVLS